MAKKNKNLIITRSNYTVKEKHKKLVDKIFYERDYMTTTDFGGPNTSVYSYGNGNFKFIQTLTSNQGRKRRHNQGNWLEAADGSDNWTLVNSTLKTMSVAYDSEVPTPEYTSMLDFCYFGSAVELVKNSLTHIINTYTGELYVSYNGYLLGEALLGEDKFTNPVVVENPYNIDIVSSYKKNVDNELRYFFKSRGKYKIVNEDEETVSCEAKWDVQKWDKDCYQDGDLMAKVDLMERVLSDSASTRQTLTIYQYYINGKGILVADGDIWSGYHIRPINNVVEKYHNSLDGFEKLLLNTSSSPLYTATLDYEYEDKYGIVSGKRSFTWPLLNGWNLDIESSSYERYVNELLELANYYDERYSNNLWRMIVHESVKNTETSIVNDDRDSDEYEDALSQFETLMLCYGHFFDEMKRGIDDVKRITENTSYSEDGETNEHLSKTLSNKGWIVSRITDTLDDSATTENLYANRTKQYDLTEMNKVFLNYLNINGLNLMRQKGTRKCIESVLGLFGLTSYDYAKSLYDHTPENKKKKKNGKVLQWSGLTEDEQLEFYDYKLNEHVVVASNEASDLVDSDDELPIETYHPVHDNDDKTLGLPVKILYCMKTDSSGGTVEQKYMIPWFKNAMYSENKTYFQMYGGWGKMQSKMISQKIAPLITEIFSGANATIYDETANYLKVAETIHALLNITSDNFYDGMIYYIDDVSDIVSYNTGITDPSKVSNYLILRDVDYCNEISSRGWDVIPTADIENADNDGVKVLYLESIVDDARGNNPHVGYLRYDDGSEYLEYFKQVFKYYIDNDLFGDEYYDCTTGELLTGITSAGFTLSDLVMDNVKTWFFTDTYETPLATVTKDIRRKKTIDGDMIDVDFGYKKLSSGNPAYVGKKGVEKDRYPYGSEMKAFNLETQDTDSYDEAAANSIINVKNMELVFNKRISSYTGFKAYLYKVIMNYLKQVIPSTTIWGVRLEAMEAEYECFDIPTIVGITDQKE